MTPISLQDWQQAAQLFSQGRYAQARTLLEQMLARAPESAEAWLALAQVDIHAGEVRLAAQHALSASRARSGSPKTSIDIAAALLTVGETVAARACLEKVAAQVPAEPGLRHYLALQYQNLGDHAAALAWMEKARDGGLVEPAARFELAVQLTFHGRLLDAEGELEACAQLHPPFGRAMVQLSQLRRQTPEHNHLQRLERQIAMVPQGTMDHAALEFARYKELEDIARYDEAWRSLEHANAIMHGLLHHDTPAERRTLEALRRRVVERGSEPSVPAHPRGPVPIFIVGLPRSGTTLLDRLLGNHDDVWQAGELGTFRRCLERAGNRFTGPMLDEGFVQELPRVDLAEAGELYLANSQWRANGRRFYIDKMPRNWLLVPLIQAAIPEARILHMTREPIAVAFSNYRSYFGADYPYCYDQDALACHYHGYREAMRDWHASRPGGMLDVSYRTLVADPESELRKVLAFCGLDWQPDCLDLARNDRPVATLSATQVRGGIDTGMGSRWRHYGPRLAGLRSRIDAAAAAGPRS